MNSKQFTTILYFPLPCLATNTRRSGNFERAPKIQSPGKVKKNVSFIFLLLYNIHLMRNTGYSLISSITGTFCSSEHFRFHNASCSLNTFSLAAARVKRTLAFWRSCVFFTSCSLMNLSSSLAASYYKFRIL